MFAENPSFRNRDNGPGSRLRAQLEILVQLVPHSVLVQNGTPGRNLDGFRSGKNRVRQAENSNFFRAPPERFEKQGSFRYGRARGAAAKNRCLQRTPRFATGTMGLDQDSAHNLKLVGNSGPNSGPEILVQLVPHSGPAHGAREGQHAQSRPSQPAGHGGRDWPQSGGTEPGVWHGCAFNARSPDLAGSSRTWNPFALAVSESPRGRRD